MARRVVSGAGWAAQAAEAHPRMIATAGIHLFIGQYRQRTGIDLPGLYTFLSAAQAESTRRGQEYSSPRRGNDGGGDQCIKVRQCFVFAAELGILADKWKTRRFKRMGLRGASAN